MEIAADKVTEFVLLLREISVKAGPSDPDSGSNPIDDGATDVLVSDVDDPAERQVRSLIAALNEDERAELLALVYVGRGDMDAEQWDEAVAFARERAAAGEGLRKELLGNPNASELLEEGLEALGLGTEPPPV